MADDVDEARAKAGAMAAMLTGHFEVMHVRPAAASAATRQDVLAKLEAIAGGSGAGSGIGSGGIGRGRRPGWHSTFARPDLDHIRRIGGLAVGLHQARRQLGAARPTRALSENTQVEREHAKSESAAAVAVTGLEVEREAPGRPVAETRDALSFPSSLRPVFHELRSRNLAGLRP